MTGVQLNKIRSFCKPFYRKAGKYHGWDHIEAVRRNALQLARKYREADLRVLEVACYIHDVGRSVKDKGHPQESVRLVTPFLRKIGVVKTEVEAIHHAVVCHDKDMVRKAKTLEAKLLFDADKLEILSVYGFMRVWFWLVEERKMDMGKAMDFLWKWADDVRRNYLQTPLARRIADKEMKILRRTVDAFVAWS